MNKLSKINNNIKKLNLKKLKLKERIIRITRVSKVTKGGKRINFQAVIALGNEKGKIGIGIAKAKDTRDAIEKAKTNGYKTIINFPVTKSLSINHSIIGEYKSSKILVKPAKPGSGILAGGSARIILEVAGIKNVVAKQFGSNNRLNNAYALFNALKDSIKKLRIDKLRRLNN
uniref:Small ribosomal subunit protein uS5c n=1 Tax=Nitzschia sp. PL1-4 TaxID=2083272 RepID=A0A2Z5ZA89_9STRA|nr:ribosomal protein S5 [Nitzschia sp. PL1-4]